MIKRILKILFWIVIIVCYFLSLDLVSERRHDQICTGIKVAILDSAVSGFVTKRDILEIANNKTNSIIGISFDSIKARDISNRLYKSTPVRDVVIYKTIDGIVHIDVKQRAPIVRIINRFGENFYIDDNGDLLKHFPRYYSHVLVANGFINLRAEQNNYNVLTSEVEKGKRNIMRELYELSCYINSNKFWKAQIQQIYVNEEGEFELIPSVGSHIILFGTSNKIEYKFSKLESFYRNGLNVKGWNNYEVINLKYEGQIIAERNKIK